MDAVFTVVINARKEEPTHQTTEMKMKTITVRLLAIDVREGIRLLSLLRCPLLDVPTGLYGLPDVD